MIKNRTEYQILYHSDTKEETFDYDNLFEEYPMQKEMVKDEFDIPPEKIAAKVKIDPAVYLDTV